MRSAFVVATLALAVGTAGTSQAAFVYDGGWTAAGGNYSAVGQRSAGATEASFAQILSHMYGGSFAGANGMAYGDTRYTNGSGVTVSRVQDFGVGSPLDLGNDSYGGADDQLFVSDGSMNVSTRAVFAGYEQSFGVYDGTLSGRSSADTLFNVTGTGFAASGSADNVNLGSSFGFMRSGGTGSQYSVASHNYDRRDHMLAYEITGLNSNEKTWLVFFEDKFYGERDFDFDFNDLVVEVRTAAPIPTPAAAGLGVIGLGMAGWVARREKKEGEAA